MRTIFYKSIVILTVLVVLSACTKSVPETKATLYDRLGGKEAIQAVVNDFVDLVRADERITKEKNCPLRQ